MTLFRVILDFLSPFRRRTNLLPKGVDVSVSEKALYPDVEEELKPEIDGSKIHLNYADQPTWKLILIVAERLRAESGDFRLTQIVKGVQQLDRNREWTSIQPVVQGMTANAGKGPPSPCGRPLVRVSHGIYRFGIEAREEAPQQRKARSSVAPLSAPPRKAGGINEVESRVAGLIDEFATCLKTYDQQIPFTRSGQYSLHRATIDRRRSFGTVLEAIEDEEFLQGFHQTLYAWGIGKRASKLVPLVEFRDRLSECSEEISGFEHARLDDPNLDLTLTSIKLWRLIERLGVVENVSLIVPGTKTLHHLLPDLVPPMDRAWTGAFFQWSMATPASERSTFIRTFSSFAKIARATDPASFVGEEWRTSLTKILDNGVIGYCKLHDIAPRGS